MTVLRIVKESGVLDDEDFENFSCWLKWLHDCNRSDPEFLELFVEEVLPPILKSADAMVLYENLERDKDLAADAVYLIKLAIREKFKVVRFNTLISGLAERLLAPKQKEVTMNVLPKEGTGAGEYQSRARSTPQTT